MQEIKTTYRDKVEFIFFGWNGKFKKTNHLKEMDFTFIKPVHFADYYTKLNELKLDMALLPLTSNHYNTKGKSPTSYLELSTLAIPVIASNQMPYNEVIENQVTGLLADSSTAWVEHIKYLIEDKNKGIALAKAAQDAVWKHHSYRDISSIVQLFKKDKT